MELIKFGTEYFEDDMFEFGDDRPLSRRPSSGSIRVDNTKPLGLGRKK